MVAKCSYIWCYILLRTIYGEPRSSISDTSNDQSCNPSCKRCSLCYGQELTWFMRFDNRRSSNNLSNERGRIDPISLRCCTFRLKATFLKCENGFCNPSIQVSNAFALLLRYGYEVWVEEISNLTFQFHAHSL